MDKRLNSQVTLCKKWGQMRMDITKGVFTVKKPASKKKRFPYSEKELLAGLNGYTCLTVGLFGRL